LLACYICGVTIVEIAGMYDDTVQRSW